MSNIYWLQLRREYLYNYQCKLIKTGAILSVAKTQKKACSAAFDSSKYKTVECNYPVHKQEILAIIQTLEK